MFSKSFATAPFPFSPSLMSAYSRLMPHFLFIPLLSCWRIVCVYLSKLICVCVCVRVCAYVCVAFLRYSSTSHYTGQLANHDLLVFIIYWGVHSSVLMTLHVEYFHVSIIDSVSSLHAAFSSAVIVLLSRVTICAYSYGRRFYVTWKCS